jgi:hypothetical protein
VLGPTVRRENYRYADLNHDALSDLAIATSHNSCASECLENRDAFSMGNGVEDKKVRSHLSSFFSAFVLHPGTIGPRAPFVQGGEFGCAMLDVFSFPSVHYRRLTGKWHDVTDRNLGLASSSAAKTHFGWARLTVHDKGHAITTVLAGYAYETIPNHPIITGKKIGPTTTASNNRMILAPVLL